LERVSRNGAPLKKFTSKTELDVAEQGWANDTAAGIVWVKFFSATSIPAKIVLNRIELVK
jgi:hypothetical protein